MINGVSFARHSEVSTSGISWNSSQCSGTLEYQVRSERRFFRRLISRHAAGSESWRILQKLRFVLIHGVLSMNKKAFRVGLLCLGLAATGLAGCGGGTDVELAPAPAVTPPPPQPVPAEATQGGGSGSSGNMNRNPAASS